MQKLLFIFITLFVYSTLSAQYTRYFKGYKKENSSHEIQLGIIPLSVSSDLELNQTEIGWRKGTFGISFRYGIDNSRTEYFDVNFQGYFWITKHIDITTGFGFGNRTNLDFILEKNSDRYYIPYNIGIVIKPVNFFQIITKYEKFDHEHNGYWQSGVLLKFPLSNQ